MISSMPSHKQQQKIQNFVPHTKSERSNKQGFEWQRILCIANSGHNNHHELNIYISFRFNFQWFDDTGTAAAAAYTNNNNETMTMFYK